MTPGESANRVVVIGGGISGLAAAHRLVDGGPPASVTLIEASTRLGGKVMTDTIDGFLVEGGPDSFVTRKGAILDLAGQLGLSDRVISSRPEHRGAHVWSRGRLRPVPEGLLLMAPSRVSPLWRSSLLSWRGKLRVLADLVIPRREVTEDISLEAFVVRRLGREMLDRLAEPLIAGIHAAEPSTMSLAASFPRFLEMEREHRSLILAARSAAAKHPPDEGLSHFASFTHGMGELTAALIDRLGGVDIRTGLAVTGLTWDPIEGTGSGFRLRLDDGSEIRAAAVIVATPAAEAASLLSGLAPVAGTVLQGIRQVATATVTLAFRTEDVAGLVGSGFVVPAIENRRIMGCSYLSRKWEGRTPDTKCELLRAFVGGPRGQDLAVGDPDRLVAAVQEELAEILKLNASPVMVKTQSWRGGLHQYTLGHTERVAEVEKSIAAHPGLALAGAALYGIGLNECVESGRRAADAVLSAAIRTAGDGWATEASGKLPSRPGGRP